MIAEAVVHPETERYVRLQDVLETTAVAGTYVVSGSSGFDFSLGPFQMKPSFVEELEKAWMHSGLPRRYELWFDTALQDGGVALMANSKEQVCAEKLRSLMRIGAASTPDNATARRVRLTRLQKEEWQVIYVGVFLRQLYASYGSYDKNGGWTQDGLETLPAEEQVRLAATAYNRGCVWPAPGYGDLDDLRAHAREKHFHYDLIPGRRTRRYCYATLALNWYKKLKKQ